MILPSILKGKDMPKHLAINATDIQYWALKNKKNLEDAKNKFSERIAEWLENQIKKEIPILTLWFSANCPEEIEVLNSFFMNISKDESVHENKVRIYVIGDWYNINSDLTDNIRIVIENTKDYDQYFLNICLNYDGQKEILTSVKLMLKKALAEKLNIDDLKLENIKENLATSYFIPPELIIEQYNSYSGLLLWDSIGTKIYFSQKHWLDIDKYDFEKAINLFNKKMTD